MRKGFTLIEVLIVLSIIGILAAILTIRATNLGPEAKNKRAYADLKNIKTAVEAYIVDTGKLPSTTGNSDDLEAALTNASRRLIDYIPDDVWKTTVKYGYATDTGGSYYCLYSVGKDGAASITVASTDQGTVSGGGTDDIWVSNCKTNNQQLP